QLIPYFDKNFTFEPDDAKKYGMCFRSNFYLENYASTSPSAKKKYDLVFIGSVHTDRWQVGEKVEKQVNQLGFHSLFHYYAPSRWVMLMRKFLDKNLKGFNLKKITSKKLSHQETAELYAQSKAILDINKPFQKGLSMRIFDALAMKCKVITTNEEIKNYPFYNPKNILIIDRENPKIDKSFLETYFEEIPKEILQTMSLDAWLLEIFS
ncbi:MAG: hypothetical protein Q4C75_03370, partial [Bergeyella zoohelcum]|nr:hypothetical protein [Bergeyella zoohelcum]